MSQTPKSIKTSPKTLLVQQLLQLYGALLTPKQLFLAQAHYLDGKTFSEIAREQNVSRQAVHDAIGQVNRQLEWYEDKLQLSSKTATQQPASCVSPETQPLRNRLEQLRSQVSRQRIIYSVDWIVRDLNDILSMLEPTASSEAQTQQNTR